MRAALARKLRRVQNQTAQSLVLGTFNSYARHFAAAPLWKRLLWAVRGRIA